MYSKIFSIILFLLFVDSFANIAQPGFWGAGGTSSFSLLFEQDSNTYKKIQMKEEQVFIQLYKGYAVVKGVYTMYNTSNDSVRIISGYPVNGLYDSNGQHHLKAEIVFDDLYDLKVSIDQQSIDINKKIIDGQNQWYIWETFFEPNQTIVVCVYFIVNTNNTMILKGYDRSNMNGFIYLIETAATWKAPIEKGELFIELKDNLDTDDIRLFYPDKVFMINRNHHQLYHLFKNLKPTYNDNIMIGYDKQIKNFDFNTVLKNKDTLFETINVFSATVERDEFYEAFELSEEIVDSTYLPDLIKIGVFILIGVVILIICYMFYKRMNRINKQ